MVWDAVWGHTNVITDFRYGCRTLVAYKFHHTFHHCIIHNMCGECVLRTQTINPSKGHIAHRTESDHNIKSLGLSVMYIFENVLFLLNRPTSSRFGNRPFREGYPMKLLFAARKGSIVFDSMHLVSL